MSGRDYAIAGTHVILAGTSIWVLSKIHNNQYAYGSFGIIALNSILGVWKYGNPRYGNKVDGIFRITVISETLFSLAGIACDMYIHYGYEYIYGLAHGLSAIPWLMYLINDKVDNSLVDLTILANIGSMGYISTVHNNYYGMYAAGCLLANHYIFRKRQIGDVPIEIMYNLGMCFYTYLAWHALTD